MEVTRVRKALGDRVAAFFLGVIASAQVFALDIDAGTFAPGDYSKTLAGANVTAGEGVTVRATLSKMICRLPELTLIQAKFQERANNGLLRGDLTSMESRLNMNPNESATRKLGLVLEGIGIGATYNADGAGVSATSTHETARNTWASGQSLTLTPRVNTSNSDNLRRCLTEADARAWHLELIRIARAYVEVPVTAPALQRR